LASGLPLNGDTPLLRVVFNPEINAVTGDISSLAFMPRPVDVGLWSTEHGGRPGGASKYREQLELSDVAGIWAVIGAECETESLPLIDDGGEEGRSPWHISVDYRQHLTDSNRLNNSGKKKAKRLRDRAQERGPLA
jgi:hypothetical protein